MPPMPPMRPMRARVRVTTTRGGASGWSVWRARCDGVSEFGAVRVRVWCGSTAVRRQRACMGRIMRLAAPARSLLIVAFVAANVNVNASANDLQCLIWWEEEGSHVWGGSCVGRVSDWK